MNKLKNILKRKIDFMHKARRSRRFYTLVDDFQLFISSTPEVIPVIQKIVREGKITKDFLTDIVIYHIANDAIREENNKLPFFYTKEMESKYQIIRDTVSDLELDAKEGVKIDVEAMKKPPSIEEERVMYFNVIKLYNDIIEEIDLNELRSKDNKVEVAKTTNFDSIKSLLFVFGKRIKIQKFSDQYHTLRIMFEDRNNLNKEWFFSEISEKYDPSKPLEDKKFYNAIYQVAGKAKTVGISDLFITTRQSVRINSKYLS